jgi:hypothetical protein
MNYFANTKKSNFFSLEILPPYRVDPRRKKPSQNRALLPFKKIKMNGITEENKKNKFEKKDGSKSKCKETNKEEI